MWGDTQLNLMAVFGLYFRLLQLAVPVFAHVDLPNDSTVKKGLFGLEDRPEMIPIILRFLTDVLLLPYR